MQLEKILKIKINMTNEEIRIAMAELDGRLVGGYIQGDIPMEHIFGDKFEPCANYPEDLNAVHEVEKKLPKDKRTDYHIDLIEECGGLSNAIEATALQRCEAILKTLGKWKE